MACASQWGGSEWRLTEIGPVLRCRLVFRRRQNAEAVNVWTVGERFGGNGWLRTGLDTMLPPNPHPDAVVRRSGRGSLPEILKPSQNQPLNHGKDHRGRHAEHEASIRCF
jgi:hypothetical protein